MVDSKDRRYSGFREDAVSFGAASPTIAATDAKNRFGELLDMARKEPVHVQKNGRTVAVLVSIEQFEAFEAAKPSPNPLIMRLHEESKKRWGKVYEALAK